MTPYDKASVRNAEDSDTEPDLSREPLSFGLYARIVPRRELGICIRH